MSDNRCRYRAINGAMKRLYPTEPRGNTARHLQTLAALISGIVGSDDKLGGVTFSPTTLGPHQSASGTPTVGPPLTAQATAAVDLKSRLILYLPLVAKPEP